LVKPALFKQPSPQVPTGRPASVELMNHSLAAAPLPGAAGKLDEAQIPFVKVGVKPTAICP
jgi:hypothetical protein